MSAAWLLFFSREQSDVPNLPSLFPANSDAKSGRASGPVSYAAAAARVQAASESLHTSAIWRSARWFSGVYYTHLPAPGLFPARLYPAHLFTAWLRSTSAAASAAGRHLDCRADHGDSRRGGIGVWAGAVCWRRDLLGGRGACATTGRGPSPAVPAKLPAAAANQRGRNSSPPKGGNGTNAKGYAADPPVPTRPPDDSSGSEFFAPGKRPSAQRGARIAAAPGSAIARVSIRAGYSGRGPGENASTAGCDAAAAAGDAGPHEETAGRFAETPG